MWLLKIMSNPMARINYNEIQYYESLLNDSSLLSTEQIMKHIADLWQEIFDILGG